jgi:hypothetical protein
MAQTSGVTITANICIKGTLTVKIDDEITQLTQSQQDLLAKDRERWQHMGKGAHLDDWLAYGPGLMLRRQIAQRIAHVNRPEGKGYNAAFGALLEQDGLHTMDKASISAVLWLHDPEHLQILQEIRATMTIGDRARFNSPITARQRVKKFLDVRAAAAKAREEGREAEPEETIRNSPTARLKNQIAEQTREIEHLKERLAAAEARDGSFFDLRLDKIDTIASVILNRITPGRAEEIARALLRLLKAQKTPVG